MYSVYLFKKSLILDGQSNYLLRYLFDISSITTILEHDSFIV